MQALNVSKSVSSFKYRQDNAWAAIVERAELEEDIGRTISDAQWAKLIYNFDKAAYQAIDTIIDEMLEEEDDE